MTTSTLLLRPLQVLPLPFSLVATVAYEMSRCLLNQKKKIVSKACRKEIRKDGEPTIKTGDGKIHEHCVKCNKCEGF